MKLEEMKPEGEEWTVKNFRRLLKKHIIAQEAGDLQTKLFQKPDKSLRPPISNKLYPYEGRLYPCEGRPPRNCRRSNSERVLVGISKIYRKTGKS